MISKIVKKLEDLKDKDIDINVFFDIFKKFSIETTDKNPNNLTINMGDKENFYICNFLSNFINKNLSVNSSCFIKNNNSYIFISDKRPFQKESLKKYIIVETYYKRAEYNITILNELETFDLLKEELKDYNLESLDELISLSIKIGNENVKKENGWGIREIIEFEGEVLKYYTDIISEIVPEKIIKENEIQEEYFPKRTKKIIEENEIDSEEEYFSKKKINRK